MGDPIDQDELYVQLQKTGQLRVKISKHTAFWIRRLHRQLRSANQAKNQLVRNFQWAIVDLYRIYCRKFAQTAIDLYDFLIEHRNEIASSGLERENSSLFLVISRSRGLRFPKVRKPPENQRLAYFRYRKGQIEKEHGIKLRDEDFYI